MKKSLQEPAVIFFLVVFLMAFVSIITGWQEAWGRTYWVIGIITGIFMLGAYAKPDIFEFKAINPEKLNYQILVGFLFGTALITSYIFSGLSLLSPLSVPGVQSTLSFFGGKALPALFMLSILVSVFEENFRASALRPTLQEWLQNPRMLAVAFLAVTSLFYFLFDQYRSITIFLVFGSALAALVPSFIRPAVEKKIELAGKKIQIGPLLVSIIGASFLFSILHIAAAGLLEAVSFTEIQQAQDMLISAFIFGIIAGVINSYFDSSNTSKIAHTINNAGYLSNAMGLTIGYAYVVGIIHAVIVYSLNKTAEEGL